MQNVPRYIVAAFDEVAEFIEAISTGHPKVPRPVVDHYWRSTVPQKFMPVRSAPGIWKL
ncbi:hypothetical protein ACFT1A_21420 [Rhodococcus sp. NPDC057135]|uniref:hypothetical protein n=1 Tax=Rhodococcus sp. NPDC057135 TaxID=3346028 RepID=UPI00362DBD75